MLTALSGAPAARGAHNRGQPKCKPGCIAWIRPNRPFPAMQAGRPLLHCSGQTYVPIQTGIQTMVDCIAEAWLDLGHPTNHALYSYLLSCLPASTRAKYYSESPSSDPQPHQQGFNQNRRTDQLLRQHLGSAFARLVKCAHFPDDYSEPGQVMTCCSSQSNNKKDDDGLHTERRKGRHASLSA